MAVLWLCGSGDGGASAGALALNVDYLELVLATFGGAIKVCGFKFVRKS